MIFFKNQQLMPLLWLVFALIPLFVGELFLRRRQERQFLEGQAGKQGLSRDQFKRSLYLVSAALFAFIALLRPSWNPTVRLVEKEGRDVVFLLDVSRSMSASDVAPSRLERAKLEIGETVQIVEGDRIALVAFAGNSVVKCPLTMDYGFFSQVLEDIDVNSVSRGGSQLGDALRMVESQVFDDRTREERDIILITDGEDQDSFPVEAAQALGNQGVRLIVIGLGDHIQGARVKDGEGHFLVHEGQEVWSRMNGDILREMAAATPGGSYVPAGQSNFSLPRIYKSLVGQSAKQSSGEEETLVYEEKYQFFLALALIFLVLEALRLIGPIRLPLQSAGKLSSFLFVLFLLGIFSAPSAAAEGKADLYKKGQEAFAAQDWGGFKQIYDELAERGASEGKGAYNRGLSSYEQGNYGESAGQFGEAASLLKGKQAAQALFNRGNALLKAAESETEQAEALTDQAREAYEKALELNPRYDEAARNLELLLQQQENQSQQNQQGDQNQESDGQDGEDSQNSSGQQDDQQGDSQGNQNPADQSPGDQPQDGESSSEPSASSEEEEDRRAQDILDQEEQDRDERESTLSVSGGVYQVEKDW
ncbi:MAG: VWA domain-containing protein [Spirochaetales bacterium]|nr:VWA domain-containing protein [Spirochaetales bacterium]